MNLKKIIFLRKMTYRNNNLYIIVVMSDSENESQCEYDESKYESESEYDETYLYNQISKFSYFNRCDRCIPVKNMQKVLLGKCDV